MTSGNRDALERQRTVRNTIEWSARLLSDDERQLLWRLSVFSGRFPLEAVEAVAATGTDVLTILEALIDASLVRQQDRDGRTYFQLLATVREYAQEQLDAQGAADHVRALHAGYYLGWGQRTAEQLIGPNEHRVRAALTGQLDNLRAAVRELLNRGRAAAASTTSPAMNAAAPTARRVPRAPSSASIRAIAAARSPTDSRGLRPPTR